LNALFDERRELHGTCSFAGTTGHWTTLLGPLSPRGVRAVSSPSCALIPLVGTRLWWSDVSRCGLAIATTLSASGAHEPQILRKLVCLAKSYCFPCQALAILITARLCLGDITTHCAWGLTPIDGKASVTLNLERLSSSITMHFGRERLTPTPGRLEHARCGRSINAKTVSRTRISLNFNHALARCVTLPRCVAPDDPRIVALSRYSALARYIPLARCRVRTRRSKLGTCTAESTCLPAVLHDDGWGVVTRERDRAIIATPRTATHTLL